MVINYGNPNDTLQDMLNRQSTTISGAQAAGAEFVIFRGGTNGAGGGDFLTKYAQIVDAFINAGLFVFCSQIPPTTSGGSSKITLNDGIEAICAARPLWTRYVEDSNNLGDGSYNALASMFVDGIHHSPLGAYTSGQDQAPIFGEHFITEQRILDGTDTYEQNPASNQWVRNPLMTGTSGTVGGGTGTAPNNWTVTVNGGGTTLTSAIVAADAEDTVQVPWLRVRLMSAGGNTHTWQIIPALQHPAIAADYTAVRLVDCVIEVRLVDLDTTNIKGITMGANLSGTYIQPTAYMQLDDCGTVNQTLVMRNAYYRLSPTAYSANQLRMQLWIEASAFFASPAGYVDVRCASARGVAS